MKYKIAILGSGNLATHLALALETKTELVQLWSRNFQHAEKLNQKLRKSIKIIDQITDLASDLDFILVALKDDVLTDFITEIPKNSAIWLHFSGIKSLEIWPYANTGIIYPLQSFSKNIAVDWSKIPLFLESKSEKNLKKIENFAQLLSSQIYQITTEQKQILHLAAVLACNFSNFFYGFSEKLLTTHHLSFHVLEPLLQNTLEKALQHQPFSVQTGPARRQDEQTLTQHREILKNEPELLEIYNYISEKIKNHYANENP